MRINPNVPSSNSAQSQKVSDAKSTGANRAADQSSVGAGGQLASDSAQLSSLATQLGKFPPVRQSKVQALQQQFQTGNYSVDANKVAQAMLTDVFGPVSKP